MRKPISQKDRDHGKNTCLTDCVAKLFGLNPRRVPFFIANRLGWLEAVRRFYRRRGLELQIARLKRSTPLANRCLYLVTGLSPRSRAKDPLHPRAIHHAVLWRGRKPFFDPSPSGKFLKKSLWVYRATPIKPKKKR